MISTTTNNVGGFEGEDLELTLEDQHLLFIESCETSTETSSETSVEEVSLTPVSIPAMLCDETLIQEIKSIPEKMAFKIGDVADILGIKQYVLRYWETEFDILNPKKASNNQRMYTRKDVENALLIRKLLHRDRFSIEGARNAMKELKAQVRKEKDITQVYTKLEGINDRVDDLILGIRKLQNIFK